jgi:hypothetical protein
MWSVSSPRPRSLLASQVRMSFQVRFTVSKAMFLSPTRQTSSLLRSLNSLEPSLQENSKDLVYFVCVFVCVCGCACRRVRMCVYGWMCVGAGVNSHNVFAGDCLALL